VTPANASVGSAAAEAQREEAPIRLMIVDDSPIARAVLSRMLSYHRDFEVVAIASNAAEALEALRSVRVDIVLLDVEMPGTTGLDALPSILQQGRGAQVLIVSSNCEDGAEATVRALALGAADTLPKPGTGNFSGRFADVLAERLRRIGRAAPSASATPSPTYRLRPPSEQAPRCLALGASTGGIHALIELLKALPPRLGAPILVTQHLPALFVPFFARQLAAGAVRHAEVAEDGMPVEPDRILVAPGDAHLLLVRDGHQLRVRLDRTPTGSGCLPSLDPMLASAAAIYGKGLCAVVLSGMGRDGLSGSGRVADEGGTVLVQDRDTSAVWGMPRAVAEAGLASAVLPPAQIGAMIARSIQGGSWR
jgi:two-component system chemotaxis response regulator CheB